MVQLQSEVLWLKCFFLNSLRLTAKRIIFETPATEVWRYNPVFLAHRHIVVR